MLKILVFIHILGAIIGVIIHWKNGALHNAALYGDGIRTATASDIIALDLICWEFVCFLICLDKLENSINRFFSKVGG